MAMRLLSTRKDKKGREWVIVTDSITDKEEPKHYSTGVFNPYDNFYKRFFAMNNTIVDAAFQWGIDLGEDYEKFYEQGLRVSQKIEVIGVDGKKVGVEHTDEDGSITIVSLRDMFEEDYEKRTKNLEERLIEGIKIKKKEIRDSQYGALYESVKDSLPQDDLEYISNIISQLKEKEIIEKKSYHTKELPQFEERLRNLYFDENKELMECFPKVHDNVKALFFHVAKYAKLHDKKIDWFDGSLEEIYNFTEKIGPRNSRIYLSCLLSASERDEDVYEFQHYISLDINELKKEKWYEYFNTVLAFQQREYSGDDAVTFADDLVKLDREKKEKYMSIVKKLEEAGFKGFVPTILNDAIRNPEFLEKPELIGRVIDVYKRTGSEREAWSSMHKRPH